MKRPIDLEKVAEGEVFGALAVRGNGRRIVARGAVSHPTPAQARAFNALLSSVLEFARKAGAERRRVKVGNVSLKLEEQGAEEILSIRKLASA